jgi:hypothetical protein
MPTDWAKVDATLAAALVTAEEEDRLPVFVHLDPSGDDADVRRLLGRRHSVDQVLTALLSADQISMLTQQASVRRIVLSGPLRLVDQT